MTDCLFTGNAATFGLGGGINGYSGNFTIINCTIAGNSADNGATTKGGAVGGFRPTVTAVNSVFWGDTGGEIGLIQGTANLTYSDVQGGYAGTGDINADPTFVNAAGGNYRLQSTSPCINVGSAAAPNLPATDLEGYIRIQGAAPDMGAYETWLASTASGTWTKSPAATRPAAARQRPRTPRSRKR